jgi:pimeloyl-ACP methyl ester carboxylesterase
VSVAGHQRRAPDWTEIDWSVAIRDATIDGRRVRYVDYGAGSPILLIHGLGGSWQNWLYNIPTLGLEHRVIAVDLPGFGRSEPLPAPAAMETQAEVLAALLDQLGIGPTTVVAHSMGGIVAITLLGLRADLIDRLVLANAGGVHLSPARLAAIVNGFRVAARVLNRPAVIRAITRRPRLRQLVFGGMMANPRALTGRFAAEVVPGLGAPGFLDALTAAAKASANIDPDAIRCPVLLIWGAQDRILPLAEARELCRSLLDARLVVIEGAGHAPTFEQPEQFNRAVMSFAEGRSPAPLL